MAYNPSSYSRRGAAAIAIVLLLAAVALDARVGHATTATWAGGIGVYNDATNWDTNPLFPCNGQGGDVYDVVIASGTITLNLDCPIDSLSQSGSTFGGSFALTILGQFDWTAGTRGGSGTTQIDGGLNATTSSTKSLSDSHTLIHSGGTGTWTAGSILLGGGGATFRNQTTWNVTGDVNHSMSDTSDTGSFENTSGGIVNVDIGSTRTLLFSPGAVENDGVVNANVGTTEFSGSGTHNGSFAGAATFEFGGGTQTLGTGASVTVANLAVTAGTLNVDPGASYAAGNTLVSGTGILNVTDAGDTITTDSATMSGGNLGGAGTFLSTGSFDWTTGTLRDAGTTQIDGGLNATTSSTKSLSDSHTLIHSGGTGTWTAGSILLGGGGATFRNQTTWNVTGDVNHSMSDSSDTGSFENTSGGIVNVDIGSTRTLLFSPGAVENDGVVNANVGTTEFSGSGTHNGSFAGAATFEFGGGTQTLGTGASVTVANLAVTAGTLNVDPGASYAAGNTLVSGTGILNVTDAGDTITTDSATMSGGNLGGAGTFLSTGSFDWTAGTLRDAGTTQIDGGLNATTSSTKSLSDSHTLIHSGGTGTWTAGSILLGGGGATFRNQTTWNVTGDVNHTMSDTSDTGSFENTSGGIVNVDIGSTRTLLFSPGAVENDGVVNANVGTTEFSGSGTHNGSFAGAATFEFGGGTQTLGTGASVTVANLAVTAGTLNVDPGASYAAGNTLVSGTGILNVTDAGDTITTDSATMSGGNLGGAGTFLSTGSFDWTAGTLRDAGTTQIDGGLNATTSSTKSLSDSHTLIHSGGTGTWTAGSILLGGGGATFRNQTTWNVTGDVNHTMSDSSDTGSFENSSSGVLNVDIGVNLGPLRTLTLSTGTLLNGGVMRIQRGRLLFVDDFLQTSGAIRLEGGSVSSTPLLDIQGGALQGTGPVDADVSMGGTLDPGLPGLAAGQLDIDGTLSQLSGSLFRTDLLGPTRGTQYDTTTVTDSVSLGGALEVQVLASFRDTVPATPFIVLENTVGSTLAGGFANVASGERVFTPDFDSFVVSYGAGSAFGVDQVVLTDYVKFEVNSTLAIFGTSEGGTITLDIGGIIVSVPLGVGLTATQVAEAIASAINADDTLRQQGIAAFVEDDEVRTNAVIDEITNTDPGIQINLPPLVPGLSGPALILLAGLIAAAGRRVLRH